MIEQIFQKQKEFQSLIHQKTDFITPYEKLRGANVQLRRAIDEIYEALREIPYDLSGYTKMKKIISFNESKMSAELVDAFLFIINALNIFDIDSSSFLTQCENKQLLNINRFQRGLRFNEDKDNFLIVIEGPDGVGKSSICKMLSQRLQYPVIRMPDTSGDIEHFSNFYRRVIANMEGVAILDRFYPSSIVYGNFFNRTPQLEDLPLLHSKREVFIFIIDREEPFRGDNFINVEQWPKIRQLYLSQSKSNKWKVINNDSSLMNCVQKIIDELQF